MIETIWGTNEKPVASAQLSEQLESYSLNGTLYIGYPIIGSPDGPFTIDAMLLSPEKGAILFHLVEGRNLLNFQEIQDESYNKVKAKLLQFKQLSRGRNLLVNISVLTFAPALQNVTDVDSFQYRVCNSSNLKDFIGEINWENNSIFTSLVAVIQAVTTIRKNKIKRNISNPNSRGSKLEKLENSIANLDNTQLEAVIETFEGVQRIRGLAGSGKTIVLAQKVAYLHGQHPDWLIAVTFNTRSLKGQFERLIYSFTLEQTGAEPDWSKIQVIHAWGAPGDKNKNGIYYTFCKLHDIEYYDFREAKAKFGEAKTFDEVCKKALKDTDKYIKHYNAVLIDEAQDFSTNFLNLCYELLKSPKRLIYAYDELQCLTNITLPSPEEIFGKKPDGTPRVKFEAEIKGRAKQDIILRKCYRNSRPLLSTAHALGFGIYRKEGLIQMFDHKELWKEIGYVIEEGKLEDGENVSLKRNSETSPLFLEEHSELDDLIQFHCFDSQEKQNNWVEEQITGNLKIDELNPNDIIVINPNPLTTRDVVGDIRAKLMKREIDSILAGVSTSPDVFFEDDVITFTGIFRAKGNEAAMVYVINADDCYTAWRGDIAKVRNQLFTAITRSKAWVRVCGVGPSMNKLIKEFEILKSNNFSLKFKYPTLEERKELNIINRDMTTAEKKRIEKKKGYLKDILESLNSGETILDDYPDEVLEGLRKILKKKNK